MNVGNVQGVSRLHSLGVSIGTTHYEALLSTRSLGGLISGLQGIHNNDSLRSVRPRENGNHNIGALGQRTAYGLEGHEAHDYRITRSLFLKVLKVFCKMPEKFVLAADGIALCNRYYD